jgi:hypothetical protein
VTERPILFSGPMVRAIIEGRKTQTRRLVKQQPVQSKTDPDVFGWWAEDGCMIPTCDADGEEGPICPYGVPGDRLWVRETWKPCFSDGSGTAYRADENQDGPWKPGIHMHRRRCRLVLEVTAVRVERLQEISQQDVFREGLHNAQQKEIERRSGKLLMSHECYRDLWDSLNAKRAPWASNPWVWVIEFKRA